MREGVLGGVLVRVLVGVLVGVLACTAAGSAEGHTLLRAGVGATAPPVPVAL